MFIKKLKFFFILLIFSSSIFLVFSLYKNYTFKNNDLSLKLKKEIRAKTIELRNLAYEKYDIRKNIPIIISNKLKSSLFGMATIDKKGKIAIFLNKKRFQESSEYMIKDVMPHEYAHALMFIFKDFTSSKAGHSLKWSNICKNLNGVKCDRFVNTNDIVIGKTNFLY